MRAFWTYSKKHCTHEIGVDKAVGGLEKKGLMSRGMNNHGFLTMHHVPRHRRVNKGINVFKT